MSKMRFSCLALILSWSFAASGQAPAAHENHKISLEGSLDEWRNICGKNNVLPDLIAPYVRITKLRMPYPEMVDSQYSTFDKPVNADKMFQHLPSKILQAMQVLSIALLKDGRLDPALRELSIVRVGYRSPSLYEVHHHVSFGLGLGIKKEKLESMACISPKGLSSSERVMIQLVDELVQRARPSDSALAAARAHFSNAQVVELVTVVGNWMMAARVLETTGVGLDDFAVGDEGTAKVFKNSSDK